MYICKVCVCVYSLYSVYSVCVCVCVWACVPVRVCVCVCACAACPGPSRVSLRVSGLIIVESASTGILDDGDKRCRMMMVAAMLNGGSNHSVKVSDEVVPDPVEMCTMYKHEWDYCVIVYC